MFWWVEQKLILAWVIEMVLDGFISQKLENWALPSQAKQGRKSLLCGVVVSWLLQYQRMFWHHCSSLKLHLSENTHIGLVTDIDIHGTQWGYLGEKQMCRRTGDYASLKISDVLL